MFKETKPRAITDWRIVTLEDEIMLYQTSYLLMSAIYNRFCTNSGLIWYR